MIRTIDLRDSHLSRSELVSMLPRLAVDMADALRVAEEHISDVKSHGEEALRRQAEEFDRVSGHAIRVSGEEMNIALTHVEPRLRAALEESIRRVRLASVAAMPSQVETEIATGARITQRWIPVDRVGLYVPGGRAVYPSSVVMNVVAAQVAGVPSIALASPPQADFGGHVHPTILATAALLGVEEVYAMGGAGAIGALAFGVPELDLQPTNVITGPGNIFVAAAKRLVRGTVGIDSEAGPTEILIIADDSSNPDMVARDLISQAEHDELASAILVTTSESLGDEVNAAVERLVEATRHRDRVRAALTGAQSAILLVSSLSHAVVVSNLYAPEHLEVMTENPTDVVPQLVNAGAIFIGESSPVSLGDYIAGSNHVLPTSGQASFSAALGPHTFLRAQQVIDYSADALRAVASHIRVLADDENLPAHADAVDARFDVSTLKEV